jgi:hypothetical protein
MESIRHIKKQCLYVAYKSNGSISYDDAWHMDILTRRWLMNEFNEIDEAKQEAQRQVES